MNNKQLDKIAKAKEPGRWNIGDGLYFRISGSGSSSWQVRYTFRGKRKWFTLTGSYPYKSMANAKAEALNILAGVKEGIDPAQERANSLLEMEQIQTVSDLFNDWYQNDLSKRLKHPQIPFRIFSKEIEPFLGDKLLADVTPRDIRAVIQAVADTGRKAVANDVLSQAKQLFRHGIKLDLIPSNPAQAFTMSDAGGQEKSRVRALSVDELKIVFQVLRDNVLEFTRENYLAFALLVSLGVRKGELIAARWDELDFRQNTWFIPAERSKTGVPLTVPLPQAALEWFKELHVRACGSQYVFPSRRVSRRREYISDDTLNHALAKLFGQKVDSRKNPTANKLGEAGIAHFVVHDLRRTCRSLLAQLNVPSHVAERCLNHKLKGVEGIYNRHDYLEERREALEQLARLIGPLI